MRSILGNLFDPHSYKLNNGEPCGFFPCAICITTNGFVKKNGEAVMGRGCAKQALQRYPSISFTLGNRIVTGGNKVHLRIKEDEDFGHAVYSFPVKPRSLVLARDCDVREHVVGHMASRFKPGDRVPGWACKADIAIIRHSARMMVLTANDEKMKRIILPRPGAGAGELMWNDVKEELDKILDDRFFAITFPPRR
jgi:hypothetical protein